MPVFHNKDLVLKVSKSYNNSKYDPNIYEPFIDVLCGDREYQKEAIREILRYLVGGEYKNLSELAVENYKNNLKLQEKYSSIDSFKLYLQLPSKLSCSIDLATGSGKSYVMYGVARIMLAVGAVDQVLVLCPSNTIEDGLTEKFKLLSKDKTLKDLMPSNSVIKNPNIKNAKSSIQKGDICIENIHATYLNNKSAISDTLKNKGLKTLVLNDEAHHMMSPMDAGLRKWKEFLLNDEYDFKFIVNLSGTCYIGNDYFTDVIYRFSLKEAIEEKFVKSFRYVKDDSSGGEEEKFEKIYRNHSDNKKRYNKIKPLTILITKDITACKKLSDKLIAFLVKKEKVSKAIIEKKVLMVTSANEHKKNIPLLKQVDNKENKIEWITSVSMLTEGWDVKNVFQIVPHEERAFNSKLLIAQVLGRGLRIPKQYRGEQPIVTIFNHYKWWGSIKHLVDEILEYEKRIAVYIIKERENFNFDIHNIVYKYKEEEGEHEQSEEFELLKKGYISFSSQDKIEKIETEYETIISGKREIVEYLLEKKMSPLKDVVNDLVNRLRILDMDLETTYSNEFNHEKVEKIIKTSLLKIGFKQDFVSFENFQKIQQAFGVVYRKKTKTLRFKIDGQDLYKINTSQLHSSSYGIAGLRRDSTLFYDEYSIKFGNNLDKNILTELIEDKDDGEQIDLLLVGNRFNFKSPTNIVITSHKPERNFVRHLIKEENAKTIDAWIKSPDMGFYSIEYSWRKGEHPKQGAFNPDFIVKVGKDILVIEIKDDNDVSEENIKKYEYSKKHFDRLNLLQNKNIYHFKFISPKSYDSFFKAIRDRKFANYVSILQANLTK